MSEKTHCPTCEDKRRIQCPCCLGRGGTIANFYYFGLGKGYLCSYCGGLGTIPCPSCRASKVTEKIERIKTNLFSRIGIG